MCPPAFLFIFLRTVDNVKRGDTQVPPYNN